MIFKVDHINEDMCGNSWIEGRPEFWEAKDAEDIWVKLGKRNVVAYWLKSKPDEVINLTNAWVRNSRGGFDRPTRNPHFNWDRDKNGAYGFRCEGEGCFFFLVDHIEVRK